MGCDQYQGFHFSPPLSAVDFGALMRRREQPDDTLDEMFARQARL
jgi:EAL domain-containing protein (putative c-di-GMP-specific phosphodiesterase class I)